MGQAVKENVRGGRRQASEEEEKQQGGGCNLWAVSEKAAGVVTESATKIATEATAMAEG